MSRPVQTDGRTHGVVIAIRREDGRWLAIRRSSAVAAPLKVCFPGGAVEAGESQEAAVIREAREELGLNVRPGRRVWRWDSPSAPLTLFGWVVEVENPSELRPDAGEIAEVLWMNAEEISNHPDAMATNREFCGCLEAGDILDEDGG